MQESAQWKCATHKDHTYWYNEKTSTWYQPPIVAETQSDDFKKKFAAALLSDCGGSTSIPTVPAALSRKQADNLIKVNILASSSQELTSWINDFFSILQTNRMSTHYAASCHIVFGRRASETLLNEAIAGMGYNVVSGSTEVEIPLFAEELVGNPWVPQWRLTVSGHAKDKFVIEYNNHTTCIAVRGARSAIMGQVTCLMAFMGQVSTISAPKAPPTEKGKGKAALAAEANDASNVARAIFMHIDP